MILTLDRRAGQIDGGGVVVRTDPEGSVLRPWCLSAMAQGWDLEGMVLEMWDRGADARTMPLLCLMVPNAAALVQPSVDRARAAANRAAQRGKR